VLASLAKKKKKKKKKKKIYGDHAQPQRICRTPREIILRSNGGLWRGKEKKGGKGGEEAVTPVGGGKEWVLT